MLSRFLVRGTRECGNRTDVYRKGRGSVASPQLRGNTACERGVRYRRKMTKSTLINHLTEATKLG